MSKVRSKETNIEIAFRKKLWSQGIRYRKNNSKYFGKPDLTLARQKIVIFIDSCFWHGCKKHFKTPQTKVEFWQEKIAKNIKRDRKVNKYYKEKGWTIIRIWEHDLKKTSKIDGIIASKIIGIVNENRKK